MPRRIYVAPALALAALMAGPWTAHAAVASLQRVVAESALSSANKSVTATCPPGKQVTGAGGEITGGKALGQVVLREARPNDILTTVTAQGAEDQNGYPDNWRVSAVAICATPVAGMERVAVASTSDSLDKAATATCPGSKRMLGTGGLLSGGGGQVALNDIVPGSSLQSVTVRGLEDGDGTTANWSVTAFAICANPVAGRERVVAATSSGSTSDRGVGAPCPPGKQPTGVGGEIEGGGGEVVLGGAFANSNFAYDPAGATALAKEDEGGTPSNWLVRAFAICASASQRVVATTPSNSEDKSDLAACPAGQQLTGGGGDVTGGGGQVLLRGIFPGSSALTEFLALAQEDGNGFAGSWFLRIYAICAHPLPGLELASFESSPTSGPQLLISGPGCSARTVGVGTVVNGGGGEVVLESSRPSPDLIRASARAREDEDGYGGNWTVGNYAICASAPAGLELVTATSDPDSDPQSVTATCPPGKNLLGVGASIDDGIGQNGLDNGQVGLDDVRPNPLLTSVTVTAVEDETGFAGDWFMLAHAICANA